MNSLARGPRPGVSTLCRCLQISTVRQRQQPFQVPIEAARKYNKDNNNKQQICNTGCTTETATLKSTFLGTIGSTLGPHSAAARSFASAWSQWDVTRRTLATTRIRWVPQLPTPLRSLHSTVAHLPLYSQAIRTVIILLSFVLLCYSTGQVRPQVGGGFSSGH